jgi:hypothetical protein
MINKKALPKNREIFEINDKPFTTTQGTFNSPRFVYLTDSPCPSFLALKKSKRLRPLDGTSRIKSSWDQYYMCSSNTCTWVDD